MHVYFKKLRPDVKTPTRGTPWAAGLDIYATQSGYCRRSDTIKVPTGLAFEIPDGHMGIFYTRGSLAAQGLRCNSTPIDSDYRGEAFLLMEAQSLIGWEAGDRIAQLVILPVPTFALIEVDSLMSSARDQGAFGSTGK